VAGCYKLRTRVYSTAQKKSPNPPPHHPQLDRTATAGKSREERILLIMERGIHHLEDLRREKTAVARGTSKEDDTTMLVRGGVRTSGAK